MRTNFTDSIDKVLPILQEKLYDNVNDINKKVIHLLTYLPQLFNLNKKKSSISILEMELREEAPTKNKSPSLIAADPECKQVKCYVDSEPLHCTELFKAVLLLLAAYYIFNINYAKEQKLTFIFLEHMIFRSDIERISPRNLNFLSILNVLDRAKLTDFYKMPKATV
ncbi:uncharacterized protein LOC127282097 [Leptopilina boulardi]|uniref:uncharacterized protein LOC127282097 n=1 Tax=Leptopilina boulardi TaxID=63433 RepID=UPI0021F63BC7|nr:uncharacterized protein LOC127282097 [Leptopilina boulardi]